jgi:hypothetical protein
MIMPSRLTTQLGRSRSQYRRWVERDCDIPGVVGELAESEPRSSGHVDRFGQKSEVNAQLRSPALRTIAPAPH